MIAVPKHPWVDAARAIAILMVIATHCGQNVPDTFKPLADVFEYGQMGVQLFFVASAVTLCMSAAVRRSEARPILAFYTRRYFRIAPLYYVGIAFYCIWPSLRTLSEGAPFRAPDHFTFENVLANVLFVHGFVPAANNTIVPGGWSIGTEFAFYAIFPALWMFLQRATLQRQLLLAAAIVGSASLILMATVHFTSQKAGINTFLYFNVCNQIGVFLVGMMLYRHFADGYSIRFPTAIFFALTLASLFAWKARMFFLVPVLSAVSYVGLLQILRSSSQALLALLQPIGRYSFSMYIFHFFFLDILTYSLEAFHSADHIGSDISLLALFFSTSLATFLFARITYRFIEQPFIAYSNRITAAA